MTKVSFENESSIVYLIVKYLLVPTSLEPCYPHKELCNKQSTCLFDKTFLETFLISFFDNKKKKNDVTHRRERKCGS